MKTRVWVFCLTLLCCALAVVPAAWAQAITVVINGRTVPFDQPPAMVGGRVMVPLRGIFEALGAQVKYDVASRTIDARQGQSDVQLQLGSAEASVNGKPVTLDVPAGTVNGRTMVPLRFVSEALGADVKWMAASQTVSISSGMAMNEPPPPQPAPPPPPPAPREHREFRPHIQEIVDNGNSLVPGQDLEVQMTGTPHCQATFDVMGIRENMPMQEVSEGRYIGRMRIGSEMPSSNDKIVVHLAREGRNDMREAPTPLVIVNNPPPPPPERRHRPLEVRVWSPKPGETVNGPFVLRGETRPMARVHVRATLERALVPGIVDVNSQPFDLDGQADANGHFEIPIDVGAQRHARLNMRIVAQERDGDRSPPYDLSVQMNR